jgi:hypothetical protein
MFFPPGSFSGSHGNILPQILGAKINTRKTEGGRRRAEDGGRQKPIRYGGMFFLKTTGGVI